MPARQSPICQLFADLGCEAGEVLVAREIAPAVLDEFAGGSGVTSLAGQAALQERALGACAVPELARCLWSGFLQSSGCSVGAENFILVTRPGDIR